MDADDQIRRLRELCTQVEQMQETANALCRELGERIEALQRRDHPTDPPRQKRSVRAKGTIAR